MDVLLAIVLMLIWGAGTLLRIYQQAHYYQIEEYFNQRYVRWLFLKRNRWLPSRPIVAFVVSLFFVLTTDSLPDGNNIMPAIFASIGALVAVLPAQKADVKKPFVRTQRATRMLGVAWVTVTALALASITLMDDGGRGQWLMLHGLGWAIFMLAPVWLMWGNFAMIPVESTLRWRFKKQAQDIMADIRPKVIGITGSYGKTTTKNYVRDLLNIRYKAYATPKSYNTLMGLCIAINRDVKDDYSLDYFVAEMGMYGMGEIAKLCQFTPPDIGLVIEVGPQHLERAGSIENIAKAKYEIIEGTQPNGVGVFNWDNDYIKTMYGRGIPKTRISISQIVDPATVTDGNPRFIAQNIEETVEGIRFDVHDTITGEQEHFATNINGKHNVTNLLMATAVAVHEGIPLKEIARRVRTLAPAESRLVRQVLPNGITIINDSYSANPVGAKSALHVLGLHTTGKRLLITPGMVELGEKQDEENRALGVLATQYATDIILVGSEQTRPIYEGIQSTGFDSARLQVVETLAEAVAWYETHFSQGDTVLFLNDLPDTYSN
jgi:UDP-N-acetylmuramoyl-tripeptide--D-alanyl-D-alanine ligase